MDFELYMFRRDLPAEFSTEAVVVIDTHNFSSTVIEALHNGAEGVIAVGEGAPEEVAFIAGDDDEELRNHPEDMTEERVSGEYIGIASHNGAPAVHSVCANGTFDALYLGSLTNAKYLAKELLQYDEVTFVAAGSDGAPGPEDSLTASYIAHQVDAGVKEDLHELYTKLNELLVEEIYEIMYDDWGASGELGLPDAHAFEYVSNLDSREVVPKLDKKYFRPA